MTDNTTKTDWNINSDIYDIVDSVNNLKKRYIADEDETTLSLGIFGFISDTESKKIQTATIMAGQLGNEMFPTRAILTKNILTHAAYTGITDFNAVPAQMTTTICIRTADIDKYKIPATTTKDYFYLDHMTPIFIEDYEFHLDFDIRITRKTITSGGQTSYGYSAEYIVMKEDPNDPTQMVKIINPISDIDNPYIQQPFMINIGNDEYIGIQCTLRQCSIEEVNDVIVSDSIIENKTYSFEFDNQLADFRVTVVDNGKTIELEPYMFGTVERPEDQYYCWYIYTADNKVRVTFDSSSFIPGLNADIYIKIYNTLGNGGNFEYLNIDRTSEGVYLDIGSDNYGYKNITTYLVAVTDSENGADRKTTEELKKLIPKAAMTRGAITTETDLNNYFNLINNENNRLVLMKKEDNQLNRIWYSYFLLKDDLNNIIPTNTVDIMVSLNADSQRKGHVIRTDDGRYVIPAGTHFRYDPVTNIAIPIDEAGNDNTRNIPPLYSDEYFNSGYYYYMNFYTIIITDPRSVGDPNLPLSCGFYLTSCDYDSYFTYSHVNQESDIQFIANRFHVKRNFLIDKPVYHIDFNLAQSINDGSFEFVSTHEETFIVGNNTETDITTTQNGRAVFVFYKDDRPYRWKECEYITEESEPEKAIFHFRTDLETDSRFDNSNCIKIDNVNEIGSEIELYGFFPEFTKAKLFILAHIPYDATDYYPREDFDEMCPGYEDYAIVNVYDCVNDGIRFFINMTNKTDSIITPTTNTDDPDFDYKIRSIPMVGKHYLESEVEASYVFEAVSEKNAYIDYCLKLLENSMNVDFKFFNTYGESRTYKTKTYLESGNGIPIGNIDCTFTFKLSLKDISDTDIVKQIKADIKETIEDINDISDFHAPNLVTEITTKYEDRIHFFEFMGFNTFDSDYQHIVKEIDEATNDLFIVPEFINIRNVKDSATNTLVPAIEIYLV